MSISSMVAPNAARTSPLDRTLTEEPANNAPLTAANAFEQLTRYIPSEIVTVYVALTSAMENAKTSSSAKWIGFGVFVFLTPVVTCLIFAAKVRARGKTVPHSWRQWPYWKICAAVIAFTAWATALPHGPFWEIPWFNPGYGPVALLGTTALLGLLGAIFDPISER